jgi:nucleoside-diphosphate-sugar epimerase
MGIRIVTDNPLAEDLDHILMHTEGLWDELRGERIFITGGTGFFGCWLLESFTWANDKLGLNAKVTVLTRNPEAFHRKAPHLAGHQSVELLQGDVRSFEFPEGSYPFIIHAATEASAKLNAENPLLMLDTIIAGTRHVLDFAVYSKTKKFLLTSSGAVYGKQPPDLTHIPEDYHGAPDPIDTNAAYGNGKRMAEHICAIYGKTYQIEMKIARCFAFVGPYLPLDAHFAIGNFIRDGLRGGPIIVKDDGSPYRSYLYAADLAIGLWTILFSGGIYRPYNLGSEQDFTIAELARRVGNSFQTVIQVKIAKKAEAEQASERYVPSTHRALQDLNFSQYIDFQESIRRTVSWHK